MVAIDISCRILAMKPSPPVQKNNANFYANITAEVSKQDAKKFQ